MKTIFYSILVSFLFAMTGCAVVGGIFKAGMMVGVILSIMVVVLAIWLVMRMGRSK